MQERRFRAGSSRRFPIVPVALTALVGLGALAPRSPLRDAVTLEAVSGVGLWLPPRFVVLSPVLQPMDVLTCLSSTQHVALVVTLCGLFVAWRLRRRCEYQRPSRRVAAESGAAAVFLVAVFATYAAVVALRRPMAALRVEDPDVAVVDFHSHTDRSHDGRNGFGQDANRRWHTAAGFDVAYVTDHYTWGRDDSSAAAGRGTVLLSGAELRLEGRYVNALGDSTRYAPLLTPNGKNLRLERLDAIGSATPLTLILARPLAFERIEPVVRAGRGAIVALELHDGDPRAIEQRLQDHDRLIVLANRLGLTMVSGSNLHGWGRAAAAWTLVQVPGWRALTPTELGVTLAGILRANRQGSVRVVERAVIDPAGSVLFTLPRVAAHLFRTLQPLERLAWLVWIWGAWLLRRSSPRFAARITMRCGSTRPATRPPSRPGRPRSGHAPA